MTRTGKSSRLLHVCLAALILAALPGCMALPGSGAAPNTRYLVAGGEQACETGGGPLSLSVAAVGAGLNTDRIARREAATGKISYLKGARWADPVGPLLEQRMAQDLECAGYTVLSAHHQKLGQAQMVCEVRAFNLVDDAGDSAEAWLSCMYYPGGDRADLPLVSRQRQSLGAWNATAAVAALSSAYHAALRDIISGMR